MAHRRNGDLQRAYDELTDADLLGGVDADMVQQLHLARLRTDWLAGHVDAVCAELPAIHEHFAATGNRFLATESAIELAVKAAILDELDTARKLLAEAEPLLPDMPGQLARILHGIAAAAVAVGVGAEDRAADLLRDLVLATLGQPDGWYWRDRGAIALTYVWCLSRVNAGPTSRSEHVHVPGLRLGEALIAARAGDLHTVRRLEWPAAGIVRAHLPARWIVELAAAARAAGTPHRVTSSSLSALDFIACSRRSHPTPTAPPAPQRWHGCVRFRPCPSTGYASRCSDRCASCVTRNSTTTPTSSVNASDSSSPT